MLNFGSNLRILFLKLSVGTEIVKLKRSRKNFYSFHIDNKSGISEESARSLAFRDTREQANKVMLMLRKLSNEKKKSKDFSPQ
jgi:hypothetical protein